MKVLVTGGSGLLGSAISLHFKDYFDVIASYAMHKVMINELETIYLDITDAQDTINLIKKIKPDLIVHTAALVGVNICEREPELAYKINVDGTKNLADAAEKINSKIIYISTDYIFDGKKGMYKESDTPNPINTYGETKLEGEKLIDTNNNVIIRTSTYGWNVIKQKRSFSNWLIDELANKKQINVFTDQVNSMMLVNNCAEALKEIVDKDFSGILNIASSEKISKYQFAIKLADIFNFDKELIKPIKNNEVDGYEKRPLDVSLDISKAKMKLKTKLLNVNDGLLRMKNLKDNGYLSNFKAV